MALTPGWCSITSVLSSWASLSLSFFSSWLPSEWSSSHTGLRYVCTVAAEIMFWCKVRTLRTLNEVGLKLSEVGPNFFRSWLEVHLKMGRSWLEFVRSSYEVDSNSFEVRTKWTRSLFEVGPRIVRNYTPSHQEGKVLYAQIDLASIQLHYTYVLAYALSNIHSPHFSVIHAIVCMLHTLPIHIVLFSRHVMLPVLFLQHLFFSLVLKASIVFLLSSLCRCLMRASYYCPLSWTLLPCKFDQSWVTICIQHDSCSLTLARKSHRVAHL